MYTITYRTVKCAVTADTAGGIHSRFIEEEKSIPVRSVIIEILYKRFPSINMKPFYMCAVFETHC